MDRFKFEGIDLEYPSNYYIHYSETFLLNIYNSHLIKKGDTVLDIGASTGDFCFLASKKTGPDGKIIAIEPNPNDFETLLSNIDKNRIHNIIPINIGVSNKKGQETITFGGNKFIFNTDTLINILNSINIESIDFIKMDIEGYEHEVIKNSIEIIEKAHVIALEFHNTKDLVDSELLKLGFKYCNVTNSYLYKNLCRSIITHPLHAIKTMATIFKNNPKILYMTLRGHEISKNNQGIFVGYYIKQ
jgi:23S rRNA U2552 (ribose-2'-O)-methylase RlmE/FtsJ